MSVVGIGALNESPLHAALKRVAAPPGSQFEVYVGGYVVDAVSDGLLVEIQTRNFGAMRAKLAALLPEHRVRLVMPIASRRWIVRLHADGSVDRRRSPKRGVLLGVFAELVALPLLLSDPNFELEIVLTEEDELRRLEPGKAWRRRGWVVVDRRLVGVVERHVVRQPADLLALLPADLPPDFTTVDLAALGHLPRRVAQQAAYCMAAMGLVARVGKRGNLLVYRILA